RVSPSTRVGGTCRPGAKLLTVTDNGLPPPGSCYVLFAGTNDVTADESHTIFEHLERQLNARLSSSAVIVSTVPHRHDLSMDHAVNQRIALVNFYIEELSVRYKGIEVLNFNKIGCLPNTVCTCDCLAIGCWLSFCWGVLIVSVSHQPSDPQPRLLMLPLLVRPLPLRCLHCLAACGAGHRWVHYIETSSSTYDARTCFLEIRAGAISRGRDDTPSTAVRQPPHRRCLWSNLILFF
ncbi:hypothetical protein J6590_032500, partial [Homalodisca vitripennis]